MRTRFQVSRDVSFCPASSVTVLSSPGAAQWRESNTVSEPEVTTNAICLLPAFTVHWLSPVFSRVITSAGCSLAA